MLWCNSWLRATKETKKKHTLSSQEIKYDKECKRAMGQEQNLHNFNDNWSRTGFLFPHIPMSLRWTAHDPVCHLLWEVHSGWRAWGGPLSVGGWCLALRLVTRHRLPNQASVRLEHLRIRQLEWTYRGLANQNPTCGVPEDVSFFRRPIPQGRGHAPYRHWEWSCYWLKCTGFGDKCGIKYNQAQLIPW